jgi:hypothetical protein
MNNPNAIIMVRPANFAFNSETAVSNKFQNDMQIQDSNLKALREFDDMVNKLRLAGIQVHLLHDSPYPVKPDAVFPNNWISFHPDGLAVLYPMEAPNRRIERRMDVFDFVDSKYINNLLDITGNELDGRYLEGTGSIIFDHNQKTAYCAVSSRSNAALFEFLCKQINYRAVSFEAIDFNEHPIYHTNVMLSIGDNIIVICSESILNPVERNMVLNELRATNRVIIEVDFQQMNQFAANCLEVNDIHNQPKLVMSETAYAALKQEQIEQIQGKAVIVTVCIPTIEQIGGGSARCMMLGVC